MYMDKSHWWYFVLWTKLGLSPIPLSFEKHFCVDGHHSACEGHLMPGRLEVFFFHSWITLKISEFQCYLFIYLSFFGYLEILFIY